MIENFYLELGEVQAGLIGGGGDGSDGPQHRVAAASEYR